ncbi:MAG: carboxymuconolactone decarboxylase family protein [Ilumatobacter sp.]|uniref:carboxymuconolactone decarboxylase family protein n=1 Tax=Ilumatobacter sp. TaxID=1967498 RepID=UPI0039193347
MRFAVAKQDGLDESLVDAIDDGWTETSLSDRHKAALGFADAYLDADGPMTAPVKAAFEAEFDDAEQAELGVGLALFHGFSKVLIAMGCEPEEMQTTELPTPGS